MPAVWSEATLESDQIVRDKRVMLLVNSDSCRACEAQENWWRSVIEAKSEFQVVVLSSDPALLGGLGFAHTPQAAAAPLRLDIFVTC